MNNPPFHQNDFFNPWNVLDNPQLLDIMRHSAGPFPYNVINPKFLEQGVQVSRSDAPQSKPHPFLPPTLKNYQQLLASMQKAPDSESEEEPSEDKDKKQKKKEQDEKKKKKMNAIVSFDSLTAGTVSNSSGIFNGKNIQFGWSSHSKTNTGFGSVGGHDNKVDQNTNVVFDNDQLDTPIDDRDKMWSPVPSS